MKTIMTNQNDTIICPVCNNGKYLKISYYLTSHKQTQQHKKALQNKSAVLYKNDEDSRKVLSNITNQNRKKQIESVGIESVRLRESHRKFNQRLKNKGEQPLTLEQYQNRKGKIVYQNKPEKDINKVLVEIKQAIKANNNKFDAPTIEYIEKAASKYQKVLLDEQNCKNLIDEIKKQAQKQGDKPAMDQHLAGVKRIHKLMFKKPMDCSKKGLDWLKNHESNIDFVKNQWDKIGTQKQRISNLSVMCKYLHGFRDAYTVYSQVSSALQKEIEEEGELNIATDKQAKNWVPFKTIIARGEHLSDSKHKAIHALYTELPVRRGRDHREMYVKFVSKKNTKDKLIKKCTDDKTKNYLIVSSKSHPIMIIYNTYKTSDIYGTISVDISKKEKLGSILKNYITEYQILNNDPLFFTDNQKNSYQQGSFSTMVKNVFSKGYTQRITINLIRHIQISEFWQQYSNASIAVKKAYSKSVGNDITTNEAYKKLIKKLENDEDDD
jgi:hypothetical protein